MLMREQDNGEQTTTNSEAQNSSIFDPFTTTYLTSLPYYFLNYRQHIPIPMRTPPLWATSHRQQEVSLLL